MINIYWSPPPPHLQGPLPESLCDLSFRWPDNMVLSPVSCIVSVYTSETLVLVAGGDKLLGLFEYLPEVTVLTLLLIISGSIHTITPGLDVGIHRDNRHHSKNIRNFYFTLNSVEPGGSRYTKYRIVRRRGLGLILIPGSGQNEWWWRCWCWCFVKQSARAGSVILLISGYFYIPDIVLHWGYSLTKYPVKGRLSLSRARTSQKMSYT